MFLGKDEVISLFDKTDVSEDEDEVHFNIYMIDSDIDRTNLEQIIWEH